MKQRTPNWKTKREKTAHQHTDAAIRGAILDRWSYEETVKAVSQGSQAFWLFLRNISTTSPTVSNIVFLDCPATATVYWLWCVVLCVMSHVDEVEIIGTLKWWETAVPFSPRGEPRGGSRFKTQELYSPQTHIQDMQWSEKWQSHLKGSIKMKAYRMQTMCVCHSVSCVISCVTECYEWLHVLCVLTMCAWECVWECVHGSCVHGRDSGESGVMTDDALPASQLNLGD